LPKQYNIDVDNVLKEMDKRKHDTVVATNTDPDLIRWLKHGIQGSEMTKNEYDRLKQKYGRNLTATDTLKEIGSQAVCPRCEGKAYRDKGWNEGKYARCPKCGWSGQTITVKEYLDSRMHK
jgi:predicted RNA-binding Zn-ribbon protein involved in translation (DUF1610 family)